MLIEFSVQNYRSIRERIALSMIATSLDSQNEHLVRDNVITASSKLSLLRSAVIYGANASGKSNLISAFAFFKRLVTNSSRESQVDEPIPTEPFALQEDTKSVPTTMEAVFLDEGTQYRYGFSVTRERIVEEWLYHTPPGKREATLFHRDSEVGIHIPQHSELRDGRPLRRFTRDNALFLSVAAQLNSDLATRIRHFFTRRCPVLSTSTDAGYIRYTRQCIEQGRYLSLMERLLDDLDLDIDGLSVVSEPLPIPSELTEMFSRLGSDLDGSGRIEIEKERKNIKTRHAIRDNDGNITRYEDFPMEKMESEGTQKIIALCGPLFDVLTNGYVLLLDEIDARLHPLLTHAIVRLFHSSETNPKNAQLICATHDTNLLDRSLFRRDQIYFTEKDRGATKLYSLAEFKPTGKSRAVRSDASFERNYIEGRYGAIPYLGDLRELFAQTAQTVEEETEE